MKEHLVAAVIRPLVQTASGVGRETKRADGCIFIEREQPASSNRPSERTSNPGGTKTADHLLIHNGPADRRADLVAADSAQDEIAPAGFLLLREREQSGKNHDTQMADR